MKKSKKENVQFRQNFFWWWTRVKDDHKHKPGFGYRNAVIRRMKRIPLVHPPERGRATDRLSRTQLWYQQTDCRCTEGMPKVLLLSEYLNKVNSSASNSSSMRTYTHFANSTLSVENNLQSHFECDGHQTNACAIFTRGSIVFLASRYNHRFISVLWNLFLGLMWGSLFTSTSSLKKKGALEAGPPDTRRLKRENKVAFGLWRLTMNMGHCLRA